MGQFRLAFIKSLFLQGYQEGAWQPEHDIDKSNIFSLGMVIMHAGLLAEMDECYELQGEEVCFYQDVFAQKLFQFRCKYSGRFSDLIEAMTKLDEAERISLEELDSLLQGFTGVGVGAGRVSSVNKENKS